jgi:cardiolipin synthase
MTHFIKGNHIQLLRNGAEYFPALEAAIAQAKNSVYLQTYIYAEDAVGISIGNALVAAARRGVAVHLLVDGFGSKDLPPSFVERLEEGGVQVMFYRPKISPWTFKKNRLRRLHQKVALIDGSVGFVGGINIIDDFDVPNPIPNNVPPRIDYAVRIEGPLLVPIAASVLKLWRRMAWLRFQLDARQKHSSAIALSQQVQPAAEVGHIEAAFVVRDNVLRRRDIERAYLTAIEQAHTEIIIANAYFVPGHTFRKALIAAAARGVQVTLLLQGRLEYFLMLATHAFYSEFLYSGIHIFEYRKSLMHSKVAVIDGHWATVGSSNLDPFSLLLAREANVVVNDAPFSTILRASILANINAGAVQIDPHDWVAGNLFKRLVSQVMIGLMRVLLGFIGKDSH